MSTPADLRRVEELINQALAGPLSEADHNELEQCLLVDDAAMARFVERCQLEAALHFELRSAAAARRFDAALSAHGPGPHPIAATPADREAPLGRRRFRRGGLLVIAATLLIALGALLMNGPEVIVALRDPRPVARLESVEDAQWLGGDYEVGRRFRQGDSIYLVAGTARLSMASGVEVALQAPCFVSLDDAMLVRLEEGALTAQVAEWAHGFTVQTETLRVVDLGTKFGVSTGDGGAAEAHVLDGQVRVHQEAASEEAPTGILLSRGEAIRLQEPTGAPTRVDADHERFDVDLSDVAPFKPIPMANTGRGLEPGDTDRHWRVTAGPICRGFNGPRFATVCGADTRYLSNEPLHSQWVSLSNPARPGAPENVTFTFEHRFDLSGYDTDSVEVSAQVLADNGVAAVRINGRDVPFEPWNLNELDQVFNRFHIVEINEGFLPGENIVEFDVRNGVDLTSRRSANPMALRVEWHAYGRPDRAAGANAPAELSIPLAIDTGRD